MSAMVLKVLSRIPKARELTRRLPIRQTSTSTEAPVSNEAPKLGGFAKAFEKQTANIEASNAPPPPDVRDFATLLRTSKFIDVRTFEF